MEGSVFNTPAGRVPPSQTIILAGIKAYATPEDVTKFLQTHQCNPSYPLTWLTTDKQDSSLKAGFLNYDTESKAKAALDVLAGLKPTDRPDFGSARFACMLKGGTAGPTLIGKDKSGVPQKISGAKSPSPTATFLAAFEDEEDPGKFIDHLVKHLQSKSPQEELSSQVGSMANKKKKWKQEIDSAGGVKSFCLDHASKVEFDGKAGGGGKIVLVAASTLKVGDRVRVKPSVSEPVQGWGSIFPWSIGTVSKISKGGNGAIVDFPEQSGWKGNIRDLEEFSGPDRTKEECGEPDARFDQMGFVRFKSSDAQKICVEFTGKVDKKDAMSKWEYGFVHGAKQLSPEQPYFEIKIEVDRSDGIGIGLCGQAFHCGNLPGWPSAPGSIGWHSDDGCLYTGRGSGLRFGPPSKAGDTLGCGIAFRDNDPAAPETVFFVSNGKLVGRCPATTSQVFPVVASSAPAAVSIKFANAAPACYQAACELLGKGSSFSNLQLALDAAAEGDTIEVTDVVGIHAFRVDTPLIVNKGVTISGAKGRKPVVTAHDHVLVVSVEGSGKAVLKSLTIRCDERYENRDGSAAIGLRFGKLSVQACDISSANGTGIAVPATGRGLLEVTHCKIGPCGRNGVETNDRTVGFPQPANILLNCLTIRDCKQVGMALNEPECVEVSGCDIRNCSSPVRVVAKERSGTITFKGTMIVMPKQKKATSFAAVELLSSGPTKCTATFEGCTVRNAPVALRVDGKGSKIVWGLTNKIEDCASSKSVKRGGEIQMAGHEQEQTATETSEDRGQDPAPKAPAGSEKDNFARFCCLLLDLAPKVLLSVFKDQFRSSRGEWSDTESGRALLEDIDDCSKRKLGKTSILKIEEAKCDEWDITLLSSLLVFSPGYLKGRNPERKAVEQLREERNCLAHSNLIQGLSKEDYDHKWAAVSSALRVLLNSFSLPDSAGFEARMLSIPEEKCLESKVEEFVDQLESVQSQFRQVAEIAEEAKFKAENAATKTEVGRLIRGALSAGHLDLNKLPQKVTLDDQVAFTLKKKAGSGGMGTVFVALKHSKGNLGQELLDPRDEVALKVCEISSSERGDREARILEKLEALKHPNIVTFQGSYLLSSYNTTLLVIEMELVKGQSLEEWLETKEAQIAWQESKPIMLQLTDGMAAVHDMNIAHRDLKPGNIMLDEVTNKIVIVDFGLSKEQNANQTVTSMNNAMGSGMYMSPEQIEADPSNIDVRTDVWSMGIIFYEVLIGKTPFVPDVADGQAKGSGSGSKRSRPTLMNKKLEARMTMNITEEAVPAMPSTVPGPIQSVILRALEKEQSVRYQTAQELHQHLKDVFRKLEHAADGGEAQPASKTLVDWTVEEVSELFRRCNFIAAADAIVENGVDGETLLELEDEHFTAKIEDGGIGLGPIQLKRIRKEMKDKS